MAPLKVARLTFAAIISLAAPNTVGGTERKKRRLPGRPASKPSSLALSSAKASGES
jgi:hypothetical protein